MRSGQRDRGDGGLSSPRAPAGGCGESGKGEARVVLRVTSVFMPRHALARLCLAAAALALAGCTAAGGPRAYAGIPLTPGAADADIQALAARASRGDAHAQLDLGIRYEEGRGVPVDLGRAEHLYREAAKARPAITYVYAPPVGRSGAGRVLPVRNPGAGAGLPHARLRLEALRARLAQ